MTSNNNLNVEKNKVEVSKNVPDLRFQGFIDDWEQRKLGAEVINIGTGRSSFTSGVEKSNETPFPVLGSTSIISYDSEFDHLGDFVLTARVGANAGNLYKYAGNVKISDNTVYIQSNNLNFIFYLLTKFDVKKLSFGTGQPLIKASELKNLSLHFPIDDEQQKIGSFFQQLDNTIALHQRKLEKLKRLKQGYLQQLFPQNDEKVPIVRFANFEDELKQRKLGEISRMYQPLTITGNDLLPDGVPVFGANGFIGFFSEANHIDDQVTISARGEGTGTPSYVHGPVWITGNSMVVNVDDFDIDKYFLFANLTANSLKKYVTGGAQPQLTRDVLVKVPITLPNADEQEKIGSFFKQLDETITLHHSKLDKLNLLKQALLQKMFI
ncbi:restriction endonuclease subunit S [Lactococcus lactis]|uniref:restriction endonuclease subunit S n=1 Tax=Lactococcus lactis TaxID=1358 RepID=UPI00285B56B8|nr:restriction endonuclease subunit S [Lactococcus lactis]MDR7696543.1 restriction endonuclease subunit S [Lactococcus lactis]MDT2880133.1 restriction endonuclease subunit S [Lactococcus lactis]